MHSSFCAKENFMVEVGQVIQVRSRQYLVEQVEAIPAQDTLVRLACLEDDALGEALEVLWEREVDAQDLGSNRWETIAQRGFDEPQKFSAYLHTLRWNCVTATDPKLFQAPYRAGIEVKAYQLAPLRKALTMPRVNLFIADDVGLGKTIEAGLILREMLMRQKVRRVVISCPPSVVRQWRDEMESRFGLVFQIFDREFVGAMRRERGWGINPWTTHSRFIVSHSLIRNEAYAGPLRDWLTEFCPGSMLILDEAHNAAPASATKYAVDSQLTKVARDLCRRFEHKLFLSATPHNGHSNSFAALLEMLDPQRFCRGVPIKSKALLESVMVRRLKQDLREMGEEFPERKVIAVRLDGLPLETPELLLSRLLADYRQLREERLKDQQRSVQTAAMLVLTSLQKRLLSSVEAFARTLRVHRDTLERHAKASLEKAQSATQVGQPTRGMALLVETPGMDDERSELSERELEEAEDYQMNRATTLATPKGIQSDLSHEVVLVNKMLAVAEAARFQPDARIEALEKWIRENLCPNLGEPDAQWLERRVLIFTEYTDTKRYLQQQLQQLIAGSDREHDRIGSFHGGMGDERREEIKSAFNSDPKYHPLRILIATDAAREGINLQNHCADLFHFDVPWNPSRMEQRNGRIDRKLQREKVVRCYYFVYAQRAEDRVLEVLVRKTDTIQQELGSLAPVLERRVSNLLELGIRHEQIDILSKEIEQADEAKEEGSASIGTIRDELEVVRVRKDKLRDELDELQNLLHASRKWLGLEDKQFREALSASLAILGAGGLVPVDEEEARKDPDRARWMFPLLDQQFGADPRWSATLDTLRVPRKPGQKPWEWRKESPIRPVIFSDSGTLDGEAVHLHLEQRVVQRLLSRFLAQGFVHDELTRACVLLTKDPIPRVVAIGRLALYGSGAARLHDEVIAMAAEWISPERRGGRSKLRPLPEGEKDDVLEMLEKSLATPGLWKVSDAVRNMLREAAPQDVLDLAHHLEKRAETLIERATRKLTDRGKKEAAEMKRILEEQQKRIEKQVFDLEKRQNQKSSSANSIQLEIDLKLPIDERRQVEADRRYWKARLLKLEEEMLNEPKRIESTYEVKATRIEPVGLVYLWPISG
jgi:SNF2 family DNA or RNA helicase